MTITLKSEGETALFILLATDGTVNRLGTGSIDDSERQLFIGTTAPALLPQALRQLTDAMLSFTGCYDVHEKRGPLCQLTISLLFSDESEDGFEFDYGSESEGPPGEIVRFVENAVSVTNEWYKKQVALFGATETPPRPSPWWRIW